MRVLLAEDDPRLAPVIALGLEKDGHEVVRASDGEEAARLLAEPFDVCVLDLGLPLKDGVEVLREARAAGVTTPVLVLTARASVPDRVGALRLGADDYLVKPFAFAELSARVEALGRRGPPRRGPLRIGGLLVDEERHVVEVDGRAVELSAQQLRLLACLARRAGQVVARSVLLDEAFGYGFDPGTNLVDVHISKLRQRIDSDGPSRIETVRGVGYRLVSR
jgi:two-component system OmpR family response regulator